MRDGVSQSNGRSGLDRQVKDELLRDVARLSFSSAAIYPILFLLVYFSTTIHFSTVALCGFFAVLPAGVARLIAARSVLASTNPSTGKYPLLLKISVIASVLGWSFFSGSSILDEGPHSWNATFLLLVSSGLAAGGASSLVGDLKLGRLFLFCLWLSHSAVFLVVPDYPSACVVTLYCFYLSVQLKRQHMRLVGSIIDREVLSTRAEELKLAHSQASLAQKTAEQALVMAEQARHDSEEASLAKSRFLATISHEIRTPLHGVLGANSLLATSELSAEQMEYVETIRQSGEALLELINDVLDFSKLEAGREESRAREFELSEILEQCMEIVRPQAQEKSLSLDLAIDEGVPDAVWGDSGHLRQIMLNLLSNAVKFTDSGGVRVDVTRLADREPNWVEFRVADTGIGISSDQQKLLFEPFIQLNSSTTRTRGGTGLGLAISRRLVDLLQGSLELESEEGEGSTFRLQLHFPLHKVGKEVAFKSGKVRAQRKPAQLEKRGEGRILVVEDNPTNQKILERMLSKAEIECEVVDNGHKAIDRATSEEFGLVLMDCHMPELDGYDATRELIKRMGEKCPPVVAVTANTSAADRDLCRDAGMCDFLTKPLRIHELQRVLDTHLYGVRPS